MYYNAGARRSDGTFVRRVARDPEEISHNVYETREEALAWLAQFPSPPCDQFLSVLGRPSADEDDVLYGPFYLDIDAPEGALADALLAMRAVVDVLDSRIPSTVFSLYYTGHKGFHLEVDPAILGVQASGDLPALYRFIAEHLQQRAKTTLIDMAVYDRARLWRVPNTWNQKGGHYKVPVTVDEIRLLDAEQIAALGEQPRTLPVEHWETREEDVATARAFFATAFERFTQERSQRSADYSPRQVRVLPAGVSVPCIDVLRSLCLGDGEGRNRHVWVYATFLRGQGLAPLAVRDAVVAYNAQHAPPLPAREIDSILRSVGRNSKQVGCRTPELSACCPGRSHCPYYLRQVNPTEREPVVPEPTAPPVEQASGSSIAPLADGIVYLVGAWRIEVTSLGYRPNRIVATVHLIGPGGINKTAGLNLLTPSARVPLLRGLGGEQQRLLGSAFDEIASYLSARRPDERSHGIRIVNGHYEVDGKNGWATITNFTIDVKRIVYEQQTDGSLSAIREVILKHEKGWVSQLKRVTPQSISGRPQFITWCASCGDFSFSGTEIDLQVLRDTHIFGAAISEEAIALDHIGVLTHKPHLTCWANVGVLDGKVLLPSIDGVFSVGTTNYQIRGQDARDLCDSDTRMPLACTNYLNKPEELHALKRSILEKTRASLYDCRAWAALGMAFAGLYVREISQVFEQFPGLYLYGPMACGKNTLLRWIMNAVGVRTSEARDFSTTTIAAMERMASYYSGLPLVLNEFRNSDHCDIKVSFLRDVYDRVGRATARADGRTITRPVRSWTIIAGQDRSRDAAFNSRFVTISMLSKNRSSDQVLKQELDKLFAYHGSALAVQVALEKNDERVEAVIANITLTQQTLMAHMTHGSGYERIAYNYAVALAGWLLGFADAATAEEKTQMIEWVQAEAERSVIGQARDTEAITFTRDLLGMIAAGVVGQGYVRVESNMHVKRADGTRSFVTSALVLWVSGLYPLWSSWRYRGRLGETFTEHAILQALENEPYFVERDVQIPLNKVMRPCVVLDLDAMPSDYREGFRCV